MIKKEKKYSFTEKVYEWSQKLDDLGGGSPNSKVGKTEQLKHIKRTTIIDVNNQTISHKAMISFRLKSQLLSVSAFFLFVGVIIWYLFLLNLNIDVFNAEEILSSRGKSINLSFTATVAPVLMIIGIFSHFDMFIWDGGRTKITNDETMSHANMYERVGALAFIANITIGGTQGSVLINLYTIDSSPLGFFALIASWVAFLYILNEFFNRLKNR